jgi:hypothetical protein
VQITKGFECSPLHEMDFSWLYFRLLSREKMSMICIWNGKVSICLNSTKSRVESVECAGPATDIPRNAFTKCVVSELDLKGQSFVDKKGLCTMTCSMPNASVNTSLSIPIQGPTVS